jgi:hypothetical protein
VVAIKAGAYVDLRQQDERFIAISGLKAEIWGARLLDPVRCDTMNTRIQEEGNDGYFDQACAGTLTPAASVGFEDGTDEGFLSARDD